MLHGSRASAGMRPEPERQRHLAPTGMIADPWPVSAQSDGGQKRYKSTLLSGNGHTSSSGAQPGASAATSSQAVGRRTQALFKIPALSFLFAAQTLQLLLFRTFLCCDSRDTFWEMIYLISACPGFATPPMAGMAGQHLFFERCHAISMPRNGDGSSHRGGGRWGAVHAQRKPSEWRLQQSTCNRFGPCWLLRSLYYAAGRSPEAFSPYGAADASGPVAPSAVGPSDWAHLRTLQSLQTLGRFRAFLYPVEGPSSCRSGSVPHPGEGGSVVERAPCTFRKLQGAPSASEGTGVRPVCNSKR